MCVGVVELRSWSPRSAHVAVRVSGVMTAEEKEEDILWSPYTSKEGKVAKEEGRRIPHSLGFRFLDGRRILLSLGFRL